MQSKPYIMWICDTCEDGIMDTKRTKSWKPGHPCCFCSPGKMFKQTVTFEIVDKDGKEKLL